MFRKNNVPIFMTKVSFFAMLFYSAFLLDIVDIKISNMTMMLGVITVGFMALDMMLHDFNLLKLLVPEIKIMIAFLIYSFITSLLFAEYRGSAFNGLFQLVQNLILMIVTIYIIMREKSIKFPSFTFFVVMSVVSVYSIINAEDINIRLALSDSSNSNVLGHNAVCALPFVPFFFTNKNKLINIILIALATVFCVTTVLTGSRMSFICAALYVAIMFLYIFPEFSTLRATKAVKTLVFSIVLLVIILSCLPLLKDTLVFERMDSLMAVFETGEGDGQGRIDLYEKAFSFFKSNPIFGVGYANYASMNFGTYSHSTYAELLSCSGIVGTVIYAAFYIVMLKGISPRSIESRDQKLISIMLLSLMIILIVLGIGQILYYKINYFIIFGIVIGFSNIVKSKECIDEKNQGIKNCI